MAFWNKKKDRTNNKIDENYIKQVFSRFLQNSMIWDSQDDKSFIKNGYQQNPTIYSIINKIVNAASTVPIKVYEIKDENEVKTYKALTSGTINGNVLLKANKSKKEAFVEVDDCDLFRLLEHPNPMQSQSEFLTELIAFGKLTGDRYVWSLAPETGEDKGKPKQIYVLPSQHMTIVTGGLHEAVKEYILDYNGENPIPADQITHIKDFNPNYDGRGSHMYGQSPLMAGCRTLQTNNESISTGAKFLQNQTARGVLVAESDNVGKEQAKQLKDSFDKQYKGKAGEIAITAGKYSWINFGLSSVDLQLIEQYNLSVKDLCNIYGVPVELMNNTDSSTYNNIIEKKKEFWQNAVIPELIKIRDGFNKDIAQKFSTNGKKYYIDFDFSAIPELQDDLEKVVDRMLKSWWTTGNEKRDAMGYAIDEENEKMNDYLIPANLIPSKEEDLNLENPQPINDKQ